MKDLEVVKDYYVDGTEFEVTNCPAYNKNIIEGACIAQNCEITCRKNKDCIIKSHMVALSALVGVAKRNPQSPEHIGAMACFNNFTIQR